MGIKKRKKLVILGAYFLFTLIIGASSGYRKAYNSFYPARFLKICAAQHFAKIHRLCPIVFSFFAIWGKIYNKDLEQARDFEFGKQ